MKKQIVPFETGPHCAKDEYSVIHRKNRFITARVLEQNRYLRTPVRKIFSWWLVKLCFRLFSYTVTTKYPKIDGNDEKLSRFFWNLASIRSNQQQKR